MALVLTVAMLSLAGIPLTGGFIGKFMVLNSGVQVGLWLPVAVLVITSVMGVYYYLRIINTMFAETGLKEVREKSLHPFFYMATYSTLVVLVLVLLLIGVFPGFVIQNIKDFLLIS